MEFLVIFLVLVVGVIGLAILKAKHSKELAANPKQEIRSSADFSADNVYLSSDDLSGLAIDNGRGLLMLVDAQRRRTVSFEKLVSAEVLEDNVTLMTTKKGIEGVVVGGLLAGGVGAIVGGLTGRQTSKSSMGVRCISLVVIVDDFSAPRHAVTFIRWSGEKGLSKDTSLYRQSIEKAELWQSRLTIAMRHAEQSKQSCESMPTNSQSAQPSSTLASVPTALTTQQPEAKPSLNLVGQRYRIVKLLGGGAMKKVYLAEDSRLAGRRCAVAEMLDNFSTPDEQRRAVLAFQRECDLLATLDNQHIPKIYDHFSEDHRHYLVMDYVEGVTLEKMLASNGGSLEEKAVLDLARQILDTLSYLHGLRPPVIYRDLKPSNIMITSDGRIKLVDFGIARYFEPLQAGTMIGTQGYAAPEQYSGKAEPRSDIYGLGAVLHHALTGRDPTSEAPFSFPSVRHLRPDVRAAVGAVIDQALSYKPDKRPQSAEEMMARFANLAYEFAPQSALQTVSTGPISAKQAPPPKASLRGRILNFCPNCGATRVHLDEACTNCRTKVRHGDGDVLSAAEAPTKVHNLSTNDVLVSDSNKGRRSDSAFYLVTGGVILVFFLLVWAAARMTLAPDHSEDPGTSQVSVVPSVVPSSRGSIEISEVEKAATEKKLLAQVRDIPASDRDANLKIYQRLAELRPDNQLYKQKIDRYSPIAGNPTDERSSGVHGAVVHDPNTEALLVMCSGTVLTQMTDGDPNAVVDSGTNILAGRLGISRLEARQRLRNLESQYGSWDAVAERCNQIPGESSSR